jgi:hypothetical protein
VVGVASGPLSIPFATSSDPQVQEQFGIGPGCTKNTTSPPGLAAPPMRLVDTLQRYYEDAELLDSSVMSICENDFSPALERVANVLRDQFYPACAPACAADLDPGTAALDVDCEVRQVSSPESGPIVVSIPECLADAAIPDESNACWIGQTGDQIDPYCTDQGANLELGIIRRPGHPAPGRTTIELSCVWTDSPC